MFNSIDFTNPYMANMDFMKTPNFFAADFMQMNSAFNSPFGNSFSAPASVFANPFSNFGGGFDPNQDFMSMFMSTPSMPNSNAGYSKFNIDTKTMESKYSPIIEKYAQQYGVRPDVVKSMMKQESGFNPNARSGAGAMGLMQLMPGTAKDMGVTNVYDPEQNIKGGVKYLAYLLKRYNGDYRKAVAAYNGGMGNIDKKGINFCLETSNYHKSVLG